MIDGLKINQNQLKKQIGQLYTGTRDYQYQNIVTGYIGELPIKN
jgi:hypothetical protein